MCAIIIVPATIAYVTMAITAIAVLSTFIGVSLYIGLAIHFGTMQL